MSSGGVKLEPLPPQEGVDFFEAKGFKVSWNWEEVWKAEHAAAFTVAKATQMSVLTDIRSAVDDAIRNGTTFEAFKRDLIPTLQNRGWWGKKVVDGKTVQLGSPERLKTIFQTNTRVAYATGQEERAQRTKRTHPYFVYELGPSARHRPEHAAWAQTCLPVDHPWWDTHSPLNGWGCKCRKRQVSRAEAEKLGQKPGEKLGAVPQPNPTVEWKNKTTGEVQHIEEGIDPGWDYNPGKAGAARLHEVMAEKYQAAPFDLARPVSRSYVEGEAFRTWLTKPEGNFPLGVLPPDLGKALKTEARVLRFSPDSLAKQRGDKGQEGKGDHSELTPEDYLVAQAMLEDAPVWMQDAHHAVLLYDRGDKWWRLVVKATRGRDELFLQSLHAMDERRYRQALRKLTGAPRIR